MHDREILVGRFREHIAEVQAGISADRLLTYEVKEGWGPLCKFLEVTVPDTVFPHINDTAETKSMIDYMMEHGMEKTFGY